VHACARSTVTLEVRIAFSVMRDLAAHSRALGADAQRYAQQLADLIRSLDDALLNEPGDRPDLRRETARVRPEPLRQRRRLRAVQRNRADSGVIRKGDPLPAEPWQRPSGQQRDPHDRDHPCQAPARNTRLPRVPHPGGDDQTRSAPIAQASHRTRALPPTRRDPLDFIEASLTGVSSCDGEIAYRGYLGWH
jgi:hypothetical protein